MIVLFRIHPAAAPLKLGQYDELVQAYVRKLRAAGGVVNTQIVMAGARGVLLFKDKTLKRIWRKYRHYKGLG